MSGKVWVGRDAWEEEGWGTCQNNVLIVRGESLFLTGHSESERVQSKSKGMNSKGNDDIVGLGS